MSEFNFKSQRATTIEQSERLIALGLRKETADMTHHYLHSTDSYELKDLEFSRIMHLQELVNKNPVLGKSGDDLYAKDIPAWGFHRLIEMMPMSLIEDRVYHERWDLNITPIMVLYRNQDQPDEWIGESLGRGMYNNVIDCIEWLINEELFNKEYLEE